jgi:hypothetical protein
MIHGDDIKKFLELSVANGKCHPSDNMYGIVKRLEKQYGSEIVVDGMNFLSEKMIQGKMFGEAVKGLTGFCGKVSQNIATGGGSYNPTHITWVKDMDIAGIDAAIQDFSTRSGKALKVCESWTDRELNSEVMFLKMIRKEWAAIKEINKTRQESKKRRLWQEYRKSIGNLPVALLQSKHEMRIQAFRSASHG